MENPNIVLSSEQILSRLWDCEENYIDNSTLTVYIRRLRTKIEDDPGTPQKIVTVRRIGYKWNAVSYTHLDVYKRQPYYRDAGRHEGGLID